MTASCEETIAHIAINFLAAKLSSSVHITNFKFKLNLKYVKSVEITQIHSLKVQQKCAKLSLKVVNTYQNKHDWYSVALI